jgi:hypothetical protein
MASNTSGNNYTYVFWVQNLGDSLSPYSQGIRGRLYVQRMNLYVYEYVYYLYMCFDEP